MEKGKSISENFLNKDVPPDPVDIDLIELEPEIELITDPNIRKFVRYLLKNAPAFWIAPGSHQADVHPPDEEAPGGLVLHTKRVVLIASFLSFSLELENYYDYDCMIAAAILHDIAKYIFNDDSSDVVYDPFHPYTVDRFVAWASRESVNVGSSGDNAVDIDMQHVNLILRLIRCSHGIWSEIPETIPTNALERIVHQADIIASNLHVIMSGDGTKKDLWI